MLAAIPPRIVSAILVLVFLPSIASAEGDNAFGLGWQTCRAALASTENDAGFKDLYEAWLAGFLTVAARQMDDPDEFSDAKSIAQASAWINDYCRRKPAETYVAAATRMLAVHASGRMASQNP